MINKFDNYYIIFGVIMTMTSLSAYTTSNLVEILRINFYIYFRLKVKLIFKSTKLSPTQT